MTIASRTGGFHPSSPTRAFLVWLAVGLLPAFALIVGWPPMLILVAVGLVIGPVSRPEQLGLALAFALPLVVVGVLQASDGQLVAVPWLAGGIAVGASALTRYSIELRRFGCAVGRPDHGVRHHTLTALALSVMAYLMVVLLSDSAASGVPYNALAILAIAVAALPLAAVNALSRTLLEAIAAVSLFAIGAAVSFYFLPAAFTLAVAVLRRVLPRRSRSSGTRGPA